MLIHTEGPRKFRAATNTLACVLFTGLASASLPGTAHAASKVPATDSWCAPRCDRVVEDWSLAGREAIRADSGYADPMAAVRILAIVHLAMHDAVNAAAPRYGTFAFRERDTKADPAIAAVAAAHETLLHFHPRQSAYLDSLRNQHLFDAGKGSLVDSSVALGKRAAREVIKSRADDGSNAKETYTPRNTAGAYRYVPKFDFAAAPHWGKVRPFAFERPDQFRVGPPPALTSEAYTRAFDEVKAMGSAKSAARSADQSNYAAFWYEFSDEGWNRIARVVSEDRPLDLWQRARLFALINVAMSDAYVTGWDSKMHYDFWRPYTAIRLAADDGNPATAPDAAWETFLQTPPIQDYPSTHSALGAAAAEVLAHVFGRDDVAFSFTSPSALPGNPRRRFASFSAAARENADSRVMAGLHFRFACDAGLELGKNVGKRAVLMLPPLK